jgi:hypothetical protein
VAVWVLVLLSAKKNQNGDDAGVSLSSSADGSTSSSQVTNNSRLHRRLQADNPFVSLGPLLIQLLRLICLIFGGTPASCGTTPSQPTRPPVPAPAPTPVAANPTTAFNIRLQYDSSVPPTHRFLFEEAKTLFERVITADVQNVPLSALTDTTPEAPGCTYSDVDDIDICVYYTPSVALGVGGYNNRRSTGPNAPLPSTGSIAISSALLNADELLRDLIVHEMAHALVCTYADSSAGLARSLTHPVDLFIFGTQPGDRHTANLSHHVDHEVCPNGLPNH